MKEVLLLFALAFSGFCAAFDPQALQASRRRYVGDELRVRFGLNEQDVERIAPPFIDRLYKVMQRQPKGDHEEPWTDPVPENVNISMFNI